MPVPSGSVSIPLWVLHSHLEHRGVRLYAIMASLADEDGRVTRSRRTYGADLGCSSSTVDYTIASLINLGMIVRQENYESSNGAQVETTYRVLTEKAPMPIGNRLSTSGGFDPPFGFVPSDGTVVSDHDADSDRRRPARSSAAR